MKEFGGAAGAKVSGDGVMDWVDGPQGPLQMRAQAQQLLFRSKRSLKLTVRPGASHGSLFSVQLQGDTDPGCHSQPSQEAQEEQLRLVCVCVFFVFQNMFPGPDL